jgi:predicted alpha/beta hydrolase
MESEHRIRATDDVPLDARLFEPDGPQRIKAAIMLNSGAAIPKAFYTRFAQYLSTLGYAVVTYDYRGVGGSRPASLRGFSASLLDWGQNDMTSVMDWLTQRYPDQPRFIFAHSLGGQLIGLMRNADLASGIFMVATSVGYWRWMSGYFRFYCFLMWFVYIPLTARLVGYVPLKIIKSGEDLPAGVGREWASWCRRREYLAGAPGFAGALADYARVRAPIHALGFSDDRIANVRTVAAMMHYYSNTRVKVEFIRPAEIDRKRIGHFGFFLSRNRVPLWHRVADWLDRRIDELHGEPLSSATESMP